MDREYPLDSTNVYAYISIIALFVCIPPAVLVYILATKTRCNSTSLLDAITKVRLVKFLSDLFWIGMFYHLYNQNASLEENINLDIMQRTFDQQWPCFSILSRFQNLAGNEISTQTGIGTAIAIAGVAIYSLIKANMEEQKRVRILFYKWHIVYTS
ncbi:hypothetical protein DKX38_012683 [Salix brachista]|uniref:Sugar phosphate transporter domain-containing protein n=1 Tax=Salix brachista TaxID=2182728 RepID=A0A5N5LR55_9ROSI|nr:hypothetical protein DKX38_012683 [Salix brachista]